MDQKTAQQILLNEMTKEMETMFMSWDNDMNEYWYQMAIRGIKFTSPVALGLKQERFGDFLKKEPQGLNFNIVAALCNCLEARSCNELGLEFEEYIKLLQQNARIANQWQMVVNPLRERIIKRIQINAARPGIVKPMIH